MLKKMLVATDLSKASEENICALENFRKAGTDEARLIYCFNIREVGTQAGHLMELFKPEFEKQKKLLEDAGFKTEAEMVMGLPEIEINRQADEHGCSFIAVGSSSKTALGEMFLGGVAGAMIQSASRPVLVLRLAPECGGLDKCIKQWQACRGLESILFPTDFSDNSEKAFKYLRHIAGSTGAKVVLLHVQEKGIIGRHLEHKLEEFNRTDNERLERLKEDLVKAGAGEAGIEIKYGSAKKEIIRRTEGGDISMAVLGSQGRGYMGEFFLGSVSHAAARRAAVPVLLVPAG